MTENAPQLEVRPLPRLLPAEQILADARAEADRIHTAAIEAASNTRLSAQADAQNARRAAADAANDRARAAQARADAEKLLADTRQNTPDGDKESPTDKWSIRIALAAAVTLTASGEYSLATFSSWPWYVAWALPMSIDVYVVQTFRRHRDVASALILMVAANALYHLAAAGLVGVQTSGAHKGEPLWWLIVGVAAIAPFVMWRLHRIREPRAERRHTHQAPTETTAGRPSERAHDLRSAHAQAPSERPLERAQCDAHERPALTVDAHGRAHPDAQGALTESVNRAPVSAHQPPAVSAPMSALTRAATSANERPVSARIERQASAKKTPKSAPKKATKTGAQSEDEIVRALYDTLNRRPQWTEIRDALVSANLADQKASRSTMQRIRERVERHDPALAARGSTNVRALAPTGTDS